MKKLLLPASLVGFIVLAVFSASTAKAADATVSTDLDQVKTEAGKIKDVYGIVAPVSVAALTFGAGAKVLKRVIYS